MHLAAAFRPEDPLGSLSAPPDLLAAIGGWFLRLRGTEGRGEEGRRNGIEKGGGEEKREGKRRGLPPPYLTSGYGPGRVSRYLSILCL